MKKDKKQFIYGAFLLLAVILGSGLLQSCEEYPHEYETSSGVPSVEYVRMTDPDVSDSLIVKASLNTTIALIGDNLTSITKMLFNDQEAYLNTSFMTSNALIVTIPNEIPQDVTDKIYMIAGSDTVTYDFNVVVPPPLPLSMLCEFVNDGEDAVIKGSYFIDDPNVPLEVIFPGELKGEVLSVSDDFNEIVVTVPDGAGVGPVTVKSIYGSRRSSFYFKDDRNYILDWDVLNANGSWRSGVIANSNPDGISGNYVLFEGDQPAVSGEGWNEDAFSFNLWNFQNGRGDAPLYDGEISSAAIKFEINIPSEWKAQALQMIFTGYNLNNDNNYLSDATYPRGLWMPWLETGSYSTEGWTTATIPLSEFHFNHEGKDIEETITTDHLGGLTFFVWNGGTDGEECHVKMCIDNIRIVPL